MCIAVRLVRRVRYRGLKCVGLATHSKCSNYAFPHSCWRLTLVCEVAMNEPIDYFVDGDERGVIITSTATSEALGTNVRRVSGDDWRAEFAHDGSVMHVFARAPWHGAGGATDDGDCVTLSLCRTAHAVRGDEVHGLVMWRDAQHGHLSRIEIERPCR